MRAGIHDHSAASEGGTLPAVQMGMNPARNGSLTIVPPKYAKSTLNTLPQVKQVAVGELLLDHMNPRLAGEHLTVDDQDRILEVLWRERAVNELVDSIAKSGYWEHEELFAARESGKLVVIEGNRRLAAVKLLLDTELRTRIRATGIPDLSVEAREQLRTLPVIECTREDVWQYIGFKHVNGPQDWDSIAKTQYVARVHSEYHVTRRYCLGNRRQARKGEAALPWPDGLGAGGEIRHLSSCRPL